MADVAANLKDWSTTASSNAPTDATTIGAGLADNIQEIQKVVRQDLAHKGTDIASSAAPDVGAVAGLYHDITGNNTITGLGTTATAGIWKLFQTDGSPLFKHSTALQMVGAADRTASPGAVAAFICEASNQWRNLFFFNATAGAVVQSASAVVQGIVELATNAETLTGTDTGRAVTPSALDSVLGLVKLASGQCSATAVCDVTMTGYTAYANKLLRLRSFLPATDSVSAQVRASTDGGATYDTGAAQYASHIVYGGDDGAVSHVSGTDTSMTIATGIGNAAGEGLSMSIEMHDTTNTSVGPRFTVDAHGVDFTGVYWTRRCGFHRRAAQDTDAIRFLFSSGNIASGSWELYGFN